MDGGKPSVRFLTMSIGSPKGGNAIDPFMKSVRFGSNVFDVSSEKTNRFNEGVMLCALPIRTGLGMSDCTGPSIRCDERGIWGVRGEAAVAELRSAIKPLKAERRQKREVSGHQLQNGSASASTMSMIRRRTRPLLMRTKALVNRTPSLVAMKSET